ncbi:MULTISPECIES: hypothetical protein [Marinobacter]|uniref:hypothetical protein n=1 Tax=Marinobacter TaxID=2742 RepID=UPI000C97CFA0|nr:MULTISPECIES: hypothetical protein [unclassified Marinobacter]MAC21347.1 hypothetical protein [Marinobacter sp.]HCL38319.1 hypothetical protein [Marinobacter nauticus]|tara:strand:+ start:13466 stop:13864 length:399 start_codon:yes stop_codon:yes gene_type:complete
MDNLLLKGSERFRKLVENAGGFVSSEWVAQLLEISEKDVRALTLRNALIARRTASGELSFPRFQFGEPKGQVLAGLQTLLVETASWVPEELIRFLLARHNPEHTDDTPLKMLKRGDLHSVLHLASVHMEQRP